MLWAKGCARILLVVLLASVDSSAGDATVRIPVPQLDCEAPRVFTCTGAMSNGRVRLNATTSQACASPAFYYRSRGNDTQFTYSVSGSITSGSDRSTPDGRDPSPPGFPLPGAPKYSVIWRFVTDESQGTWGFAGGGKTIRVPSYKTSTNDRHYSSYLKDVCFSINDDNVQDNGGEYVVDWRVEKCFCVDPPSAQPVPPPPGVGGSGPPPAPQGDVLCRGKPDGTPCAGNPPECTSRSISVQSICKAQECQFTRGENYCTGPSHRCPGPESVCSIDGRQQHKLCAPNSYCRFDWPPAPMLCWTFESCQVPQCYLPTEGGTVLAGCTPMNPRIVCGDGQTWAGLEACDPPGQHPPSSPGGTPRTCNANCQWQ